jgi:hypothetical protein
LTATYPACPPSYVRRLNASPDNRSVDVFINGNPVAKNLAYKQFAGCFTVPPCVYHIKVYPSGKYKEYPIAEACFEVCPKSAMTIALIGGDSGLLGIEEIYNPCRRIRERCRAYFRFVNLSPNAPPLDVAYAGGTKLFRNVPYTAHTRYVPVEPGTYEFQLKPAGTNQPGTATQPVNLALCTATTVYAVGLVGGTPPLEAIASVDGNY